MTFIGSHVLSLFSDRIAASTGAKEWNNPERSRRLLRIFVLRLSSPLLTKPMRNITEQIVPFGAQAAMPLPRDN